MDEKNGDAQRIASSVSHQYRRLQQSPLHNPTVVAVRLVCDHGKSHHSHDLSCNPSLITAAEKTNKKNFNFSFS
uniref:Uncharacterized protein n=1 Tax=Noccaea caerulescens TaxID=107243 RepID=A0A1J3FAZ6_NOCCA